MPVKASALGALASAALLLSLTACSGDDKGDAATHTDEELASVALASNLRNITPELALCTGKALVDDIGVKGLRDTGILDSDLVARTQPNGYDHETATAITQAATGCWDWAKYTMGQALAYPQATDAQWETYRACVGELDDELEAFLYAGYYREGKPSDLVTFTAAEEVCREVLEPKGKKKQG